MAKFANGELRVTMPSRGGTPPEEIVATRAPEGAGGPPARIPPPELHKVPYNGLAKTPPMGWNSWNKFAGRVTAEDVKGWPMHRYERHEGGRVYYVNIDDTWKECATPTATSRRTRSFRT